MNNSIKILLTALILLCFCFVNISAKEIRVEKGGKVKSIKQAIELAQPCDHIIVSAGTYTEGTIVVDKPLFLEGKGMPVIDAQIENEGIIVRSSDVTIKGFHIKNIGPSYVDDKGGIKVHSSRNVIIEDNFLDNTFFAIYLAKSKNCIIRNNKVIGEAKQESNSGNAIHLWYCDSITIENNFLTGHRDGVYLEFVNNSHISGNMSKKNMRYGLHFMFSNQNNYTQNTFDNNGAGVAVMYSTKIDMHENYFLNNWGVISHGLLLKDITDSRITNNIFTSNSTGIYAEGSNRMEITDNTFSNNGWALKVLGNCMNNTFTRNNFIGNSFEVTTNSKSSFNNFNGNYWSGYTGYDLDRNGIGDVPYRPVKLYAYLVERIPGSITLMRSLFVDLLELAEKITPVLTPETLVDEQPLMRKVKSSAVQNPNLSSDSSISELKNKPSTTK